MKLVAAALCNDVDDATGRAPVLRVVIAKDQLEFLNGFLRHSGANAVDRVVHGVGAVHRHAIRASAGATDIEAAIRRGTDRRRDVSSRFRVDEREVDVVAAIDGQTVYAASIDCVGDFTLRRFNVGDLARDRYRLPHAAKLQPKIERSVFSHAYRHRVIREQSEVGTAIDGQFVSTRRKAQEAVSAGVVGDCRARGTGRTARQR